MGQVGMCRSMNFSTCIATYNHHHNPDTEQFHCPENSLVISLSSVLHYYSFVFLKLLYKLNHIVYNLLRLESFTQHAFQMPLRFIKIVAFYC